MSASDATVGPAVPARHGGGLSTGLRRLALLYIWLTFATVGIVVADPAPYDGLILGAALLIPVAGLLRYTRGLATYSFLWVLICAGGYIATSQAGIFDVPFKHTNITLFLALSSVPLVGFVSSNAERYVHLVLSAYTVSAIIAVMTACVGYFSLFPGAYDIFTEYGRARGTFEDPNVYGAFLVPAIVYCFYRILNAPLKLAALCGAVGAFLLFGCLLSLSRGSWINLLVSMAVFSFFFFATAPNNIKRMKLALSMMLGAILAVAVLTTVQTVPQYAELFSQRAALEQDYDTGPQGRFGGQQKALEVVITNPLGIGALEFARIRRSGDVHEVYLSMFLNTGWFGGLLYIGVVVGTIGLGIRRVFHDRGKDGLSAVLVAVFIGMALEGLVIDTDHWRHFFVIMALVWGMALESGPMRASIR